MKKKYTFAILDKQYPPYHSFVDGMLSNAYPKSRRSITLVTERNKQFKKICRYNKVACINILPERKGVSRFYSGLYLYFLISYLLKRKKHNDITILVRNEPLYLFSSVVSKWQGKFKHLVYQNSFPHEIKEHNWAKRFTAKIFFMLCFRFVNKFIAVSDLGVKRLQRYAKRDRKDFFVIPLCVSSDDIIRRDTYKWEKLHIIYIGTHEESRRLDVSLEGIFLAHKKNIPLEVIFLGGTQNEISTLMQSTFIKQMVDSGCLRFISKVDRPKVREYLQWANVGLSLFPASEVFAESSPTKLSEYLASGIYVIGSSGSQFQEKVINESRFGIVADFNPPSICDAIFATWIKRGSIIKESDNCFNYVKGNLLYENYVNELEDILSAGA